MREDLKEALERHYPNGYVCVGILKNGRVDVDSENKTRVEGIRFVHELVCTVIRTNPEAHKWKPGATK